MAFELDISIENCYGIGRMNEKLDFSNTNIYVIYAQNGVFKTSFANTISDLMDKKKQPEDKIFKYRKSNAKIFIDADLINNKNTVVFDSYDSKFDSSKK